MMGFAIMLQTPLCATSTSEAMLCLLVCSHQSLPLPTQRCRTAVRASPPHRSHLHPCVCPWTRTQTGIARTPVPTPATAMEMCTVAGVGKGGGEYAHVRDEGVRGGNDDDDDDDDDS